MPNKPLKHALWLTLVPILLLYGCIGAGTHGSIKRYEYPVSKRSLQMAVEKILAEDSIVHLDTTKEYIKNTSTGVVEGIKADYYNDRENYVTLYITKGGLNNQYTFRYYGDTELWNNSTTSQIFIAYARDKDGHGGSEGNGGVTWLTPLLRKKLVTLFETEFIDKVDKELNVKHTEPD